MHLPTRIFLIGFSASGKTTVGPMLAARLDYKPVDSDAEIERLQGASCQSIIEQKGIDYFRRCECDVLERWCREETGGMVAALGGGAVTIPGMSEQLRKAGRVIWLRISLETVISRRSRLWNRPLLALKTPAEISDFMALRESAYREAAHHLVDVDGFTPGEIAAQMLRLLQGPLEPAGITPLPRTP